MKWLAHNSLWLIGLGLCLASSGIDGAYMTRWMPEGWQWLGFVLNTTADVSGMVLTYFYGRLQQSTSAQRRKLSNFLLLAEVITVLYAWFFGWRQLLTVLPAVEPLAYRWVAPVAAGFIPSLLAAIGYAESLLAGKFDEPVAQPVAKVARVDAPLAQVAPPVAQPAAPVDITLAEFRAICATLNGHRPSSGEAVNQWLANNGYVAKPSTTARRWAEAVNN